jgi:Fe-S-cluster containining protein
MSYLWFSLGNPAYENDFKSVFLIQNFPLAVKTNNRLICSNECISLNEVHYMPSKGFKYKQCGQCCINLLDAFSTSVTEDDIRMWEQEGRDDILEWVDLIHVGGDQYVYDIWINPDTGDDVKRCPWLRKLPNQDRYTCRIHDVKPSHCRKYPKSKKHAKKTGCRGLDE